MPISGVNPTPRTTAVYASDPALPRRPQDSLPSRLLSFGRTRLALASSYQLLLSHPASGSPCAAQAPRVVSVGHAPPIQLPLHVEDEAGIHHAGLSPTPAVMLYPLPPFAMWTAFPPSDYYEGSAPRRDDHRPSRSSTASDAGEVAMRFPGFQ